MIQPLSVMTLINQQSCCGNQCYNCPYLSPDGKRCQRGSTKLNILLLKNYITHLQTKKDKDTVILLKKILSALNTQQNHDT